jgi:DNA-binding transcriptional ArsR family regulator
MTTASPIARALAALGHDARLSIYRLLVRAGEGGLSVSDIGETLDIAPSTLAHHLSSLVDAGLVTQEKQGRTVINRVDYLVMHRTVDFLTAECCSGVVLAKSSKVA